jgi:proteasome lid subunit RPN8/RPN11
LAGVAPFDTSRCRRYDEAVVEGGAVAIMFQALVQASVRLIKEVGWSFQRIRPPFPIKAEPVVPHPYGALHRILLTDGVSRTLFEEYAAHRASSSGEEETGWMILGHREQNQAVVLATLPAGALSEAGVAHIRFNALGQEIGARIVRQHDRRLTTLGVVHTHPGSLRHPSDGDLRGDKTWVGQLRGKEGVFAIGTADVDANGDGQLGKHPKPHRQTLGNLCLSWYGLGEGDNRYRPLPVEIILGPDLARPLHLIWPMIEEHASELDRLARQQVGLTFDLVDGRNGKALAVTIPLAEPEQAIRVLLEGKEVQYILVRGEEYFRADAQPGRIDQGVYLLLAELSAQK